MTRERDPKDFIRRMVQNALMAGIHSAMRRLPRTALFVVIAALLGAIVIFKLY